MASDAFVRIMRWSRPLRRSGLVADRLFQGSDEPFPGHWREAPEPRPTARTVDPALHQRLRAALDELPATWRAVLIGHDIEGRPDTDVASEQGVTRRQERAILARARAALRDLLDEPTAASGDR